VAARELFSELGYEKTTISDITERAGLTRRSYFRYFADKREVFFTGSDAIVEMWISAVQAAPDPADPMSAVRRALEATAAAFEPRRDGSRRRRAIIDEHEELRERERFKLATLADATAAALRRRGVDEPSARIAAAIGVTVLELAYRQWTDEDGPTFADAIQGLLGTVADVASNDRAPRTS